MNRLINFSICFSLVFCFSAGTLWLGGFDFARGIWLGFWFFFTTLFSIILGMFSAEQILS